MITILLVDDDPTILESVADLLRLSGYHVLTATNGIEALEVMQQHVPDLIVADVMMPHMDGYQFCEAVRSNPAWVPIPFIFLTARGQAADIRRGLSLGADHYLVKPFESDDLLLAIQTRLARVRDIHAAAHSDAERMKKQLLNIVGHELRTPLTYIYGYVHLLEENYNDLDEDLAATILSGIQQGAERLARLVEDLLLMVRLDGGMGKLDLLYSSEQTEISPLIRNAVDKLGEAATKRNVSISVEAPQELRARCVPAYVQDVVFRLVDNAIKFSKREGGQVSVKAEKRDEQVIISVQDTGVGIDPAQQKHLFERFRQIDREIMEQQGVGLGLAIARRLVHLHGGSIDVKSQPGQGSTFIVRLPLDPPV